jgi:hypothetical protein
MGVPSMLVAHMFGASFVEAAITALALAYMQKSYPEILTRREKRADGREREGRAVNPWIPVLGVGAAAFVTVFVAGLIKGGGELGQWAGLDWTTVNWSDAGKTVLVSAAISAVALPTLFFGLRGAKAWRVPAIVFVSILIWVPIGLIAPGGAFGEDRSAAREEVAAAIAARDAGDATLFAALRDVNKTCACVPNNIDNVGFSGGTLLSGYQPPWVNSSDAPWKQNLGYQFAGVSALFALAFALYRLGRWLVPSAPPDWRTAE